MTAPHAQPGWDRASLRDPHGQADKPARVRAMFDAIAHSYERVNRVATFGCDARWRRIAVAAADVRPGDIVVDVCCGTGDMLRMIATAQPAAGHLIGIDFSAGMLGAADLAQVAPPWSLVKADALRLPLANATADVVSCAFGVRNFGVLQAGLDELLRIARPGGRVVILEFARPEYTALRWLHEQYCRLVLPRVGQWLSRDRTGAYRYLPRSIETFESVRTMVGRLTQAGAASVEVRRMNLGGVVLYRAVRAGQ